MPAVSPRRPAAPPPALLASALALALLGPAAGCAEETVEAVFVDLSVSPDDVDFGAIPLGARVSRVIAVVNTGNGPWTGEVPPALIGDAFTVVRPCALPVGPGAFCEVEVAFTPLAEGDHTGKLVVVEPDGPEGPRHEVALRGHADPAELILTPAALEFGALDVGQTVTRSFTIESRAGAAIDVPLTLTGDGYFIDGLTSVPLHIEPGSVASFDVDFSPSRGGPAPGAVVVEVCGTGCGPSVSLSGEGRAPRIEVAPRAVDLGEVARGQTATATLDVSNIGAGDLVVVRLDLLAATDELTVEAPALPLIIPEGGATVLTLRYAPTVSRATLDAALLIKSNDPVSSDVLIPVEGATPGPALEILPRVAHLGVLDEGQERTLDVVLRSTGTAPADVTGATITGAGFSLDVAPETGPLAPGEALIFTVRGRATPTAVDAGGSSGAVTVHADGVDDLAMPIAFLSGTAGCQPRAPAPNVLLGSVLLGQGTTGAAVLTNIGDAPCTLDDADEAVGLPFDLGFSFSDARVRSIPPGGIASLDFAFQAVDLGQRSAFVSVRFTEQPAPLLVSATARGVTGALVGSPSLIELGPIVDGCASDRRLASFINRGGDAVVVTSLRLSPPNAPFAVTLPATPLTISPGGAIDIPVTGLATAPVGIHEAELSATTDGDLDATVRLRLIVEQPGEPIVETFEAGEVSNVDVLFVVDNSGSMADDQQLLADNFDRFIDATFLEDDISFHIGVTTTDVIGGTGGPLVDRFLTNGTASLADRFAEQALVGVEGAGIELGLEAMRRAVDDLANSANAGFLRDNAALSVVIVSDEEDNGDLPDLDAIDASLRRPVEVYVETLQALKGGNLANTPVLVSVVVSPFASARYQAVADAFNGVVLDIGTPTWGEQLSEIGAATFGLRRLFRLGSTPDATSVTVTVNGQPVGGFTVDEDARSVLLDDAPPSGAIVEVTYVAGCE